MTTATQLTCVPQSAAVDVQVLNLYKSMKAAKPPRKSVVAKIKERIANLTLEAAIGVLRTFKYGRTQLCLGRNKWVAGDLLNEKYFPDLVGRLAKDTPVFWFWGGPPVKLTWYKGTLQTVVEDRILCEINENGPESTARALGIEGV